MSSERDSDASCEEQLEEVRREVAHLAEENHQLRQSASAFGALAERMSGELQQERRLAAGDRRRKRRATGAERRSPHLDASGSAERLDQPGQ